MIVMNDYMQHSESNPDHFYSFCLLIALFVNYGSAMGFTGKSEFLVNMSLQLNTFWFRFWFQ